MFWMCPALGLIDFRKRDLLIESLSIGIIVPSAFSYADLKDMDFDEYEELRLQVEQIGRKRADGR